MPHITTPRGTFYYAQHRTDAQHRTEEVAHLPLVILIHGAGGSRLDWPGTLRKLNTLTIDLSGHGKSEGSGHQNINDYAQDIISILDALQTGKVVVAGHSMGGTIAQTIALDFPDYASGLILLGTGAYLPVNPMIINDIVTDQEKVASALAKWMWSKSVSDEKREMTKTMTLQFPPHILKKDYIACNAFDVRQRLHEIHVPTLVIAGDADKMAPLARSEELAQNIPDAKLVILENAGHMMALEQPETVKNHVIQWLKETFS